ncbi:uncharacterized protein LOC125649823 [Ostrea edulis]|uniref:uncharacterized protein LOC125649823 n=1 Tax=Ostrea edulis TaxID=37623 RepID=UPI0024AEA544|nr:uncharacterized protein LOC125649823 [Ostrea edulis]
MGPKRSNRSVPYNPELPANWTSARLRETLNSRGINFPTNARRSVLIRLIEENENPINRLTQSHNDTSHNATQRVNNNGEQRVLVDLVSKLTSTVQSLQQSVVSLNTRVNSLTAQANIQSDNAVAGRPLLRTETARNATRVTTGNNEPPTSAGLSTVHVSTDSLPISPTNESRGYDLASAFSAFQSRQVSAAAGSPGQLNNVRTTYGYASESLPLVETISPQLRQQIVSGKDVNLATLLIPYFTPIESPEGKSDQRLQRFLTIGEFIQAFGIYKNVMCEAYPHRRSELDLYERDLVDMATRYPGKGFYEYHRHFSLMAAAQLKFNNILVDWSIRNNTLFCNIFANSKPQSCAACNSTLHLTGFCPLNANRRPTDSNDSYGRKRNFHAGREICNNFNGQRGCQLARCRNAHICLECKEDHSKLNCPSTKNSSWPQFFGASTHQKPQREISTSK